MSSQVVCCRRTDAKLFSNIGYTTEPQLGSRLARLASGLSALGSRTRMHELVMQGQCVVIYGRKQKNTPGYQDCQGTPYAAGNKWIPVPRRRSGSSVMQDTPQSSYARCDQGPYIALNYEAGDDMGLDVGRAPPDHFEASHVSDLGPA